MRYVISIFIFTISLLTYIFRGDLLVVHDKRYIARFIESQNRISMTAKPSIQSDTMLHTTSLHATSTSLLLCWGRRAIQIISIISCKSDLLISLASRTADLVERRCQSATAFDTHVRVPPEQNAKDEADASTADPFNSPQEGGHVWASYCRMCWCSRTHTNESKRLHRRV